MGVELEPLVPDGNAEIDRPPRRHDPLHLEQRFLISEGVDGSSVPAKAEMLGCMDRGHRANRVAGNVLHVHAVCLPEGKTLEGYVQLTNVQNHHPGETKTMADESIDATADIDVLLHPRLEYLAGSPKVLKEIVPGLSSRPLEPVVKRGIRVR